MVDSPSTHLVRAKKVMLCIQYRTPTCEMFRSVATFPGTFQVGYVPLLIGHQPWTMCISTASRMLIDRITGTDAQPTTSNLSL